MRIEAQLYSVITRCLMPWAAMLALGCGAAPETVRADFDPGRCRAEAAQMVLDAPIQGRLDVPADAQGGCWKLDVPPGTLSIVVNLDQAEKIEGPRLRITDRIGQQLQQTPVGMLGSATTLTHLFGEGQTVIIELTAADGASSFGMEARHAPPEVLPPFDPDDGAPPEVQRERQGAGGRVPASRRVTPPPPPPPPPIVATYTRVRPIGRTRAVEFTVRFANGDEARVDWSGPVALVDGGMQVGVAEIESHKRNHAVLKVEGLTQQRLKQCVAHFARKAK